MVITEEMRCILDRNGSSISTPNLRSILVINNNPIAIFNLPCMHNFVSFRKTYITARMGWTIGSLFRRVCVIESVGISKYISTLLW